jgi:hypothetical protein
MIENTMSAAMARSSTLSALDIADGAGLGHAFWLNFHSIGGPLDADQSLRSDCFPTMGKPGAKSDRIGQLRLRAAEAAERAKHARTDEFRQILEELAEAYEEMANSIAQLEALWAAMRDHPP